ncbi:MAG: flagellar basal body-associated FliL family protein [Polyangiaceae bacterium]
MSESEEAEKKPSAPPKKKRGFVGIIVAIVLAGGSAAAGTLFGPKLLGKKAHAEQPAEEGAEAAPAHERPVNPTVAFQPIVVDLRVRSDEMHHLKVTLTFELADGVSPEEFEKYSPRGREAAILYLRSQNYDTITDPEKFETVTKELSEKVVEALGKRRVRRVMITDFVTQ